MNSAVCEQPTAVHAADRKSRGVVTSARPKTLALQRRLVACRPSSRFHVFDTSEHLPGFLGSADSAPKKLRALNPAKLFEYLSLYREGRAVSSLSCRAYPRVRCSE